MQIAFDIYCRVVDNYGDAGVCWRLARQLAREHEVAVTLWIDRPSTLQAIVPPGPVAGPRPRVRPWPPGDASSPWPDDEPAIPPRGGAREAAARRVVVSAFGCALPVEVRQRLAAEAPAPRPLWVNLEYLSAEDWVEGCHGLSSTKPGDAAVEHFFYPGFTARTGGLLREPGLLAARDAFDTAGEAPRWLAARGLGAPPGTRRFSVFCYPDAPVAGWLHALAEEGRPTLVLMPEGVAEAAVDAAMPPAGADGVRRLGSVTLRRFALMPQDDYDRLLWSCDLNFVRGEDSWIRAHWAGRPFVWQPYPQRDRAHFAKLDAFLARFGSAAGPIDTAAALMRAWSGDGDVAGAWPAFSAALDAGELAARHRDWSGHLSAQRDLCSAFLEFCRNRL